MAGEWTPNNLKGSPHRIRPETHWFQETTQQGRDDGALWFSLQLTRDRAMELYKWDRQGDFGKLIEGGARMAPTSRTALKFALDSQKSDTVGTDILVPKPLFAALEKTLVAGEISDAGLAVAGEIRLGTEIDPPVTDETAKSTPGSIPKDSPIIIAIIDDGIGIANHRFRESSTATRIKHFLDLALIGTPTAGPGVDELLGRSWNGSDIDKLLGQDEEQLYSALGLINPASELRQPLRAAVTHGTHMLDLAAGYDWRTGAAKDAKRPIIAVQLPTQVAENRSDTWLPQSLKRALDWILVKADELSAELSPEKRRLPLIVNGSFASMAGPQDGYGDVERRITQFVRTYRGGGPDELCTFVLSAGNSLQLRAAAQMDIRRGEVEQIPWRVLPDDKTPSFVQIWLPAVKDVGGHAQPQQEEVSQVEVSLVPPRDAPPVNTHPSTLGEAVEWRIGEDVLARVYYQRFPRPDGTRECITIAIRPTADDQEAAVVPSGLWLIKIKNTAQQKLLGIDLRVHRDDVGMFARTGARQSYFDDPNYERFDPDTGRPINDERRDDQRHGTRVTRQGTLSAYALAEGVLAVGGYRLSDGQPAAYSSAGREGARTPDLAAVSELSRILTTHPHMAESAAGELPYVGGSCRGNHG